MISTRKLHFFGALFLGLVPVLAQCAEPALASLAPTKTFLLEILILMPLAGLAYWLKIKRRTRMTTTMGSTTPIVVGPMTPVGQGAFCQVIECETQRFLVVHSKTGALHVSPLMPHATPVSMELL